MNIFLPQSIFERKQSCDLYGDIVHNHEKKTVSYYVVDAVKLKYGKGDMTGSSLRCIGHITYAKDHNVAHPKYKKHSGPLCFQYDENTPNIYLDPKGVTNLSDANLYLYEPKQFMQITNPIEKPLDDISIIRRLLQGSLFINSHFKQKRFSIGSIIISALNLPLYLMTRLFILAMESRPIVAILRHTSFYEHYKEWHKFHCSGKRNWNIALDKMLGILVMLILLFFVSEPTDYVIRASHLVIEKLRLLLRSLKGSPMGLKLNVHLNNFFLDCFNYHIDLWAIFLSIIEPTVQQLFIPITLLGSMGLSFQLALFADLISIVFLHAHCFYIYAAALYKVEIRGLAVLWKVVRGKRFNLLKKRVESHNYVNRQLYLATIFFTTLLFLFPTILVYYVVFTTLRLCTFSATWLLRTLRRRILEFPLQDLYQWWHNTYRDKDSIHIEYLSRVPPSSQTEEMPKICMFVFKINVHSSSLVGIFSNESGVLQELTSKEVLTVKHGFKRILEGQF